MSESESLVSAIHDLFERTSRESRYVIALSMTTLVVAPLAVWAGSNTLSFWSQPGYVYWNWPSARALLAISTYLLGFGICWAILALFHLRLALRWRTRLERLRAAELSLEAKVTSS